MIRNFEIGKLYYFNDNHYETLRLIKVTDIKYHSIYRKYTRVWFQYENDLNPKELASFIKYRSRIYLSIPRPGEIGLLKGNINSWVLEDMQKACSPYHIKLK